ncbi:hypothetical protein L6R52_15105 [Myxococcota bacterium]|nr:hypothetical protein [Myxococcota bacterium]
MWSRLSLAIVLASSLAAGCATVSARSAFTKGEKARAAGQLDEALGHYEKAAAGDPKKPEYKQALEATRAEALRRHVDAARDAEARGDHASAAKEWEAALRYDPSSAELPARRDLARLRMKQADPVEFYEAAKKLAEALPGDAAVQKNLVDAKAAAAGYHLRLADTYADAKSWDRAHAAFDAAKKIDPENKVFTTAAYKTAEARYLEGLGDEKIKAGDQVSAYQLYEKAASLRPSPGLDAKLRAAKRSAGSIIEQYEQARAAEMNKLWEEAAELYTLVGARPGAPADVPERAARSRKESAKIRSDRAKAFAEKGLSDKASAELVLALEHTDAAKDVVELLRAGLDALSAGQPGDAIAKIMQARSAAPDLAIVAVAPGVLMLGAKAELARVKVLADVNPVDALLALRKLEPLSKELAGYAELRDKLVKKAFGAIVESAEKASGEGRFDAAAELLSTALDISKPPKDLADVLRAGAAALAKKEWDAAREAFGKALAASAKSNLARVGKKVATDARLFELRAEAREARDAEDTMRAAIAYRAILALDPEDVDAKVGTEQLKAVLVEDAVRSAQANDAAGKKGAAYVYYRRVLDLDPANLEAKVAVEKIGAELAGPATEPEAFVAPVTRGAALGDACAGAEKDLRDRLVLYLNKTRKLGAEYVAREQVTAIDEQKRAAPPVTLKTSLERCSLAGKDGAMSLTVELVLEPEVLVKETAPVKLDLSGLPKDEVEDLSPKKVEKLLLGEAAKVVTGVIRPHAAKLGDWRAVQAKAALASGDAEACARAFASLSAVKAPSDAERKVARDLEQFLLNRYR